MFSKDLEYSIGQCYKQAREARHEFMTVEHLLLALLDNPSAPAVLKACGVDQRKLRRRLAAGHQRQRVRCCRKTTRATPSRRWASSACCSARSTTCSPRARRKSPAPTCWWRSSARRIRTRCTCCSQQDITRLDVVNYLSHGIAKVGDASRGQASGTEARQEGEAGEEAKGNPLQEFASNLNELAREGKIDPLIGREDEVERTIQVLCRRRKNNPLYVGEAGVGKTALAEGLAWRIVEGNVPEVLQGRDHLFARPGRAGGRHQVPRRLREAPEGRARAAEEGTAARSCSSTKSTPSSAPAPRPAAPWMRRNLIKPVLQNGELRCIGSTTFQEYRGVFEKDRALARRFQKIDIVEPIDQRGRRDPARASSRASRRTTTCSTPPKRIQAAVDLSVKHIGDRLLPDKAIDVIDEAGARQRLLPRKRAQDHDRRRGNRD